VLPLSGPERLWAFGAAPERDQRESWEHLRAAVERVRAETDGDA
jgi:hypothetical protein